MFDAAMQIIWGDFSWRQTYWST